MGNITKSTKILNKNISFIHTIKLLTILAVYIMILEIIPSSIITKLLITIPLTSGYSYIIYKAVRSKHFSIIDMFKGYKFCKRTRITFILLEIVDLTLMFGINLILNQNLSNNLLIQVITSFQILLMQYISFRFSFIRYLSMNTFELGNKPLPYIDILKKSSEISKGSFIIFSIKIIVATSLSGMLFNTIFYLINIDTRFLTSIPIITSIIARYYEELLRINILQKSDFKFNYSSLTLKS